MRRRDREITEMDEIRYVLDHCEVVHIGMHDKEDIYILPMNYGYTMEDGRLILYIHGSLEGKKWDLIRENSRVSFEMDCDHYLITGDVPCQYGYGYASIMGNGHAEILERPEEKAEALSVLMSCMTDKKFTFTEKLAGIVTVARITAESFTGKRRPVKPQEQRGNGSCMTD